VADPVIVWFRRDLRLADNSALESASGAPVLPVFVWALSEEGDWTPGGASRWWLHRSLAALDADMRARGSRLIVRSGSSADTLTALVRETGAGAVHWNRRCEPAAAAQEDEVARALAGMGCRVRTFDGSDLSGSTGLLNASGRPFQVFTPFYRALSARLTDEGIAPSGGPPALAPPAEWPSSEPLDSLGQRPVAAWDAGLRATWTPGEQGAQSDLDRFLAERIGTYAAMRDRPDTEGVSRLSPHLHFGEIGPRQIWHAAQNVPGSEPFLRQLVWREFSRHLLRHFPHTASEPLRPEFAAFPWRTDPAALRAWRRGMTGYPIVDAGMRQLRRTGWMHNRVRMLVASFLTKDLLIPWQEGARWFWDTLVDADLANNTQGWQWTAGCGADASPYFRIFNPVIQGMRFDPDGAYVRQWVPELAKIPAEWIHRPWEAPDRVLAEAGVRLGETYPARIVDHAEAREAALAAYAQLRRAAQCGKQIPPSSG